MSIVGAPKFPHFNAEEALVLARWFAAPVIKGEVMYDVHLEVPLPKPKWWESLEYHAIWMHIKSKRIDLTIENDKEIWLLEVKTLLRASGIGQLALYAYMYRKIFNPSKFLRLGYIAGRDDPSVHAACSELGITVWIV